MLASLKDAQSKLKKVQTRGGQIDLASAVASEPSSAQDELTRSYFFQAGVDEWYNSLKEYTFRSAFVSISKSDAMTIIDYWKTFVGQDNPAVHIPPSLQSLISRIDDIISREFCDSNGVFVKLSTRSPKDSKTIFRKASDAYKVRLAASNNSSHSLTSEDNARMVALSEEMVRAAVVRSGTEAVTILLDSDRVVEDLMYAYEDGVPERPVSLVIRAWDSRINPQCEFRGFVWDRKLNCIGQYWHSLYFPELQPLKDTIARDCLFFFESLKDFIPVPNAMLDLAWLGPGQVLLVEVNPLMEGLGSFKGSTGLFDFYGDSDVLTGKAPFEIRVRNQEEQRASLISHMSPVWRKLLFGF